MRPLLSRALPLALCIIITGCASRPLPKFERPIARTQIQQVRTTAYTDTESDHVQYSNHNALGGTLQSGQIHSAAADWSRWPAGTVFRIRETGEIYRVDDYGWALAGTNTIDLYKPSRSAMNAWGVRRVTIENLQWGDPKASLSVLRPRSHYRHIQRMIAELHDRMDELQRPVPAMDGYGSTMIASNSPSQQSLEPVADLSARPPAPTPIPATRRPIVVASAPPPQNAPRAVPVTSAYGGGSTGGFHDNSGGNRANGVARDPFFSGSAPR